VHIVAVRLPPPDGRLAEADYRDPFVIPAMRKIHAARIKGPSAEADPELLAVVRRWLDGDVPVSAAEEMSTGNFALHMTIRHADGLGGLPELPENLSPQMERIWRALHRRLHRAGAQASHYHEQERE
jgi:hypothetical protein